MPPNVSSVGYCLAGCCRPCFCFSILPRPRPPSNHPNNETTSLGPYTVSCSHSNNYVMCQFVLATH